jgi:hypothetical protein
MKTFNLAKLNEVEGKEEYTVNISIRFSASENLGHKLDVKRASESIKENIKISAKEGLCYYELKQHKPWFDEGCSEISDQRKHAKLQRLENPSQINGDNLNNVSRESSRHFSINI